MTFFRCGDKLADAGASSSGNTAREPLVLARREKVHSPVYPLLQAVHTGMRALIYSTTTVGSQAEYSGMRTYFFSADTLEDMNAWVRAMNQAAQVLSRSSLKRSVLTGVPGGARKLMGLQVHWPCCVQHGRLSQVHY